MNTPPSTQPSTQQTWPNNSWPSWSIATGNFASSAPTTKTTGVPTATNSSNIDDLIRENQLANALLWAKKTDK